MLKWCYMSEYIMQSFTDATCISGRRRAQAAIALIEFPVNFAEESEAKNTDGIAAARLAEGATSPQPVIEQGCAQRPIAQVG